MYQTGCLSDPGFALDDGSRESYITFVEVLEPGGTLFENFAFGVFLGGAILAFL